MKFITAKMNKKEKCNVKVKGASEEILAMYMSITDIVAEKVSIEKGVKKEEIIIFIKNYMDEALDTIKKLN